MQQTNRNKPSAGVLNGIKIVIASGAVAGAMGIWSMLAGKALNNSNVQAQDQDNTGIAELPTLIPYVDSSSIRCQSCSQIIHNWFKKCDRSNSEYNHPGCSCCPNNGHSSTSCKWWGRR